MRKWVLAIAMIAVVPSVGMAADAEAGKTVFNKCKACHQVDKNAVGPHLGGIVGRKAASVADYNYSEALKKSGITWDEASLDKFIANPNGLIPNNNMKPFSGVGDANTRKQIIDFLKTNPN